MKDNTSSLTLNLASSAKLEQLLEARRDSSCRNNDSGSVIGWSDGTRQGWSKRGKGKAGRVDEKESVKSVQLQRYTLNH